jgi:FSR family fosmidomycin resistance protein-like MFS transporter
VFDRRRSRATLALACTAHFLHDGFSDLVYVLLPVWAREFSLSYGQVGLLKTAYAGAMAAFQLPAGLLAERFGEARLLAAGTAAAGLGFAAAGAAGGFGALLALLALTGLASGVQHPLSSALTSRAFEGGARRVALGTYNFSGDVGKVVVPLAVGLAAAAVGWRAAVAGYGAVGVAAALVVAVVLGRLGYGVPATDRSPGARAFGPAPLPHPAEDTPRNLAHSRFGVRDAAGFRALAAVHAVDNATRTGFLTLLPFALAGKGAGIETVGVALSLLFAGGAAGKLVCGAIAERVGIVRTVVLTEAATAAGVLAVVAAPLPAALVLLPLVGVALNGTSSVLYGTVADLVVPERRSRAYGLFYTLGIGSGAAAPTAYGLLSDLVGVGGTLVAVGTVVLATLPLARLLRGALARQAAAAAAPARADQAPLT